MNSENKNLLASAWERLDIKIMSWLKFLLNLFFSSHEHISGESGFSTLNVVKA